MTTPIDGDSPLPEEGPLDPERVALPPGRPGDQFLPAPVADQIDHAVATVPDNGAITIDTLAALTGETVAAIAKEAAALASVPAPEATASQTRAPKKHRGVEPLARHMDEFDLGTFILGSRYVTINLILILLTSAIVVGGVVAALAFLIHVIDPHANMSYTVVGLTSAGTVAVTAGARAMKKRRGARNSQSDDNNSE